MPYCPKCGVEVERDNHPCPLCQFPIPKIADAEQEKENRFPTSVKPYPQRLKSKLLIIFRFATVVILLSISLMSYINFKLDGAFTWSKYSGVSMLASLGVLFFSFVYISNFYKSFTGIIGVVLMYLFCMDMFQDGDHWFFSLALPIVAGISIIVMLYYRVLQSLKVKGFNIVGFAFIAILILNGWIDFFVSRYTNQTNVFTWSIDSIIQFFPVALIMLYITYGFPEKVKKKLSQIIIRRFHL